MRAGKLADQPTCEEETASQVIAATNISEIFSQSSESAEILSGVVKDFDKGTGIIARDKPVTGDSLSETLLVDIRDVIQSQEEEASNTLMKGDRVQFQQAHRSDASCSKYPRN